VIGGRARPLVRAAGALVLLVGSVACGTADGDGPDGRAGAPVLIEQSREEDHYVEGGGGETITYSSPEDSPVLVEHYRDRFGPGAEESEDGSTWTIVLRAVDDDGSTTFESASVRPVRTSEAADLPEDTRSIVVETSGFAPAPG
jgi:hypothetical protein